MALTLLGNNPVAVEDGWVIYSPISLRNRRTYLLELQIFASEPDLLYSNFVVRYAYPSQNTASVVVPNLHKFYYEPVKQAIEFTISPNFDSIGDCVFAVRRFPFYSRPYSLGTCTVELAVDDVVFY